MQGSSPGAAAPWNGRRNRAFRTLMNLLPLEVSSDRFHADIPIEPVAVSMLNLLIRGLLLSVQAIIQRPKKYSGTSDPNTEGT
jgi:hypothetical protein